MSLTQVNLSYTVANLEVSPATYNEILSKLREAGYPLGNPLPMQGISLTIKEGDTVPTGWQPIDTAPKDNKHPLYLAKFNDKGELTSIAHNAIWEFWQESHEMPHICGYDWIMDGDIEEPTHWAYQYGPPPALTRTEQVPMTREQAEEIGRRKALIYGRRMSYSYLPQNEREATLFKPHDWVIDSILEASLVAPSPASQTDPSLEQKLRDSLEAMGSKEAQQLSSGELLGLVCEVDAGRPPVVEYTPGQWFMAKSVDEMEAFYHSRLHAIREAAAELGYAIGVHGSMRRDMDLIAVPWREGAAHRDKLAEAVMFATCGFRMEKYMWTPKPAGRIAISMPVCWIEFRKGVTNDGHVDLSVMPPLEADNTHWLPKEVKNLLAVIHSDGGHYLDEHGYAKACIDGEEIVLNLKSSI